MPGRTSVIGLLHPGEMGSAVGATLVAGGSRVLWVSQGRGARTRQRAEEIGLEDAGTFERLARRAEVIVSVAPPHAAVDVARAVAALRFTGLFVDANAVSPETAREIGRIVERGGARFVDGGIIGPEVPARSERTIHDNAGKAWRFVGEMEQIARTFAQAGLPTGFHAAAGEVYRRLAGYKDTPTPPSVEEAIAALLKRSGGHHGA